MADAITEDDLDAALPEATRAGGPDGVVAELLDAVDHPERLDGVTPSRVLITVCETLARFDRYDEAIEVARRAVEAGPAGIFHPRAWLAKTLVDCGRAEEGLAEFREARREDPDNWLSYLIAGESFELSGDGHQAHAWFTSGGHRAASAGETYDAYMLLLGRRRVRQDMGLTDDDDDRWVEQQRARMFPDLRASSDSSEVRIDQAPSRPSPEWPHRPGAVLWWPRDEHALLLQRWPELAESYDPDWDTHRRTTERQLHQLAEAGHTRIGLIPGSVDALAAYAQRSQRPVTATRTRSDYAEEAMRERTQPWPPSRNAPCWCGSGVKYKKCCGRPDR